MVCGYRPDSGPRGSGASPPRRPRLCLDWDAENDSLFTERLNSRFLGHMVDLLVRRQISPETVHLFLNILAATFLRSQYVSALRLLILPSFLDLLRQVPAWP
jgi:hypothetical protein